jgi:hypothetical protein
MSQPKELKITVNGVELSHGQSMTLRCALTSFVSEMATEGLGNDETGKAIARGYTDRGNEVLKIMLEGL